MTHTSKVCLFPSSLFFTSCAFSHSLTRSGYTPEDNSTYGQHSLACNSPSYNYTGSDNVTVPIQCMVTGERHTQQNDLNGFEYHSITLVHANGSHCLNVFVQLFSFTGTKRRSYVV